MQVMANAQIVRGQQALQIKLQSRYDQMLLYNRYAAEAAHLVAGTVLEASAAYGLEPGFPICSTLGPATVALECPQDSVPALTNGVAAARPVRRGRDVGMAPAATAPEKLPLSDIGNGGTTLTLAGINQYAPQSAGLQPAKVPGPIPCVSAALGKAKGRSVLSKGKALPHGGKSKKQLQE